MIVIPAKGAETFTLTVAPLKLAILADITGQAFDATKGMLIEGKPDRNSSALVTKQREQMVSGGLHGNTRVYLRSRPKKSTPNLTALIQPIWN